MSANLNSNLEVLFSKMENFISTKTVVGEPVNLGNIILVPLVEVSFGVGAGVSDNTGEKSTMEFGGGGLGGHIAPTAILVIIDGTVQMVNVKEQDNVKKLLDMVPGVLSKLNLDTLFKKKKDKKEAPQDNEDETIVDDIGEKI